MEIMIAGAKVRIDKEGRYSLNDLHKASGSENRHRPSMWMENQQTQALIAELEKAGISAFESKQRIGTFVVRELVYAYAMWLSPAFNLTVIRAFDAITLGLLDEHRRMQARQQARLEAPDLTDAIKHRREAQGKAVAHYHFSNEFDLVNRVALGKSAKEFRVAHGMAKDDPIRDHLTNMEVRCVQALQRANTTMIDMGLDYEKRKTELHKIYVTRHSAGLLAEVKRIEA